MSRFSWFYNSIVNYDFISQQKKVNINTIPKFSLQLYISISQFNFQSEKIPILLLFFKLLGAQNGTILFSNKNIADLRLRTGFISGIKLDFNTKNSFSFFDNLLIIMSKNKPLVIQVKDPQSEVNSFFLKLPPISFKLFPFVHYSFLEKPIYLGMKLKNTSNFEMVSFFRSLGIPVLIKGIL